MKKASNRFKGSAVPVSPQWEVREYGVGGSSALFTFDPVVISDPMGNGGDTRRRTRMWMVDRRFSRDVHESNCYLGFGRSLRCKRDGVLCLAITESSGRVLKPSTTGLKLGNVRCVITLLNVNPKTTLQYSSILC